jgi:hypothetical protein
MPQHWKKKSPKWLDARKLGPWLWWSTYIHDHRTVESWDHVTKNDKGRHYTSRLTTKIKNKKPATWLQYPSLTHQVLIQAACKRQNLSDHVSPSMHEFEAPEDHHLEYINNHKYIVMVHAITNSLWGHQIAPLRTSTTDTNRTDWFLMN